MISLADSKSTFEAWLTRKLGDQIVAEDLSEKRQIMASSPFVFLRGSYWRWAETIFDVCPEVESAPAVLAVGDVHLENFGTWRDAEGRLVWGVNDYDEAASMPYTLDLVRLAASIALAEDMRKGHLDESCEAILEGYIQGLQAPGPIILDREWAWLRQQVTVPDDRRAKFWKKIDARKVEDAPSAFKTALAGSMPDGVNAFDTARRVAGTGSLGRPRWIAVATWRGGPAVREAKAVLPSAWGLSHGGEVASRCVEAALGTYRSPDPWYNVHDNIVVRRLSPNNRKVEVIARADFLLMPEMHSAMGHDLANVHLGAQADASKILADLKSRKRRWLLTAARTAADFVAEEAKVWKKLAG